MQLKSISISVLAFLMVLTTACSKKAASSDNPGRTVTSVPTGTTSGDDVSWEDDGGTTSDDGTVDDVDRGGGDDIGDDGSTTTTTPPAGSVLFANYRNTIPTTKVCRNVLDSRDADTLKKFFNWDIINLEGPVTVCVEQESGSRMPCPNDEDYCDQYPNRHLRIRVEYEDDLRFWYYDSEKSTNYAKLLSYSGGSGGSTVEAILMDGAGFLMIDGYKTSTGSYNVGFSFADRPSYSAARTYDETNQYGVNNPLRRASTYADMKACASSAGGAAKFTDGTDCGSRFVFAYQFFANLDSYYLTHVKLANGDTPPPLITDKALWVQNQVTIARQYVKTQFPTFFSSVGVSGGTFGRLLLNGL
jgi:hypothetical protein